jgi:WD40 repeat protein
LSVMRHYCTPAELAFFALPMVLSLLLAPQARAQGPTGQLDFYRDVHPFLESNCIPCHNKTTTKAKLNLESPALLRKGGESGPGVLPGKGAESLVFQSAAHLGDSVMPPKDNKSGASKLRPEQLAVLRAWIDQGAKDSVKRSETVALRPLPGRVHPIHSVAVAPDGRFAACSRGDRLYLYDLAARELASTLADVSLPAGVAHVELIHSLDFSRDGRLLASGGFREVKLWRRQPAGIVRTPVDAAGGVDRSALSPDGKKLLLAQPSGRVRCVGVESGQTSRDFEVVSAGSLKAFGFSPDGMAAAFYLQDGSVKVLSTDSGEVRKQFQAAAGAAAVAWSGDAKALFVAMPNAVQLWSLESGSQLREIKVAAPEALAVSSDGKALAVGCADGAVRLFDPASGVAGLELKVASINLGKITEAEVKAARAELDAGFHSSVIAQLDAQDKTLETHEKRAKEAIVAAQKALPDREKALEPALAAKAEAEKVADEVAAALRAEEKPLPATVAKQKEALTKLATAVTAANSAVSAVEFARNHISDGEQKLVQIAEAKSANASRRAAAEAARKTSLAAQETETKLAASLRQPAANPVLHFRAVAFARSGKFVSALGSDGVQRVWSVSSGVQLENFPFGAEVASGALAGIDGDRFAVFAGGGTVSTVGLFAQWNLWKTLGGAGRGDSPLVDRVCAVRFSPDSRLLATGGGEASRSGDVHVWEVDSGRLQQAWSERHSDTVLALDFSPDGKWLASGGADRLARVSEVAGGRTIFSLEGHTHHVLGVAFRADARFLATAGGDGVVNVWSTESGERSKKILGWNKEVTSLQFQGATNTIVTSAADNQMRLVKDDGSEVRAIAKLPDAIQSAACAPGRPWIVGGGEDSVLRLWDGTNGTELAAFNAP